jgi:beta-lactamase class D
MSKYMILSSQQEVIRRRLSLQLPSSPPMPVSSELNSLASSPTSRSVSLYNWSPESEYHTTHPVPTEPDMAHRHSIDDVHSEDTHKLCEINQQIKATLTDLLNTDSARSDEKYRAWIQERLMDTEQQIRKQRRRHSSSNREMAQSIATHMSPHMSPPTRLVWH